MPSLVISSPRDKPWPQLSPPPYKHASFDSFDIILIAQKVASAFSLLVDLHRILPAHAIALSAMRKKVHQVRIYTSSFVLFFRLGCAGVAGVMLALALSDWWW